MFFSVALPYSLRSFFRVRAVRVVSAATERAVLAEKKAASIRKGRRKISIYVTQTRHLVPDL